jgi:hypothetical protein
MLRRAPGAGLGVAQHRYQRGLGGETDRLGSSALDGLAEADIKQRIHDLEELQEIAMQCSGPLATRRRGRRPIGELVLERAADRHHQRTELAAEERRITHHAAIIGQRMSQGNAQTVSNARERPGCTVTPPDDIA